MNSRPEIITDGDIMSRYKVGIAFINKHARAMGSFGRPRKFYADIVESFFRQRALESMRKVAEKGRDLAEKREQVNALVERVIREVHERRS